MADLNGVQQQAYDAYVHAIFQSEGGLLDGRCRDRPGIIGTTDQYRISSQVMATQKAPQDALNMLNMRFDPVICTLANWSAPDFVNVFEQTDVNFPIAREIAQGIVRAVKRRGDQMKLDALDASTTPNLIAANGTGFGFAKFQEAIRMLAENSAGRGKITCAISASGQADLLAVEQFTNMFYVDYKPFAGSGLDGRVVQNVEFIVIPNMLEGGLPLNGNVRTCFMWNHEALGYSYSDLQKTDMQWQGLYECWLINARIKAGSVAIDNTGIVKIDIVE
jgi:hypothetical protein